MGLRHKTPAFAGVTRKMATLCRVVCISMWSDAALQGCILQDKAEACMVPVELAGRQETALNESERFRQAR